MLDKLEARKVAARYAKALFDAAREQGQSDDVFESIQAVGRICQDVPQLATYFENPSIPVADKKALIAEQFQSKIAPLVGNILIMLAENERLETINELVTVYTQLYEKQAGIAQAQVTVPVELSRNLQKQLQQTLEKSFGYSQVVLETIVDPSIIAGVILKIGDKLIDGSYRGKLNMLRKQVG